MKKLLYFLSFSMIVSSAWSQTPSGCFSSGNDVSFNKSYGSTRGITKGDFDNDGLLDVVVGHFSNSTTANNYSFLKGLGNGKFASPLSAVGGVISTTQVLSYDLNADGDLDLIIANQSGVSIHLGQGNGLFDAAVTYGILATKVISLGDINEDGKIDIVFSTGSTNQSLLANIGAPETFTLGSTFNITGLISDMKLVDMNGDGHLDVISAGSSGVGISINNSGSLGTFANALNTVSGSAPYAVTVCDIDSDGDNDVINSNNTGNTLSVLKNNGLGVLGAATPYATGLGPEGIENYDINGDGNKDIVVLNGKASTMSIFYGSASGVLTLNQTTQNPGWPRCLVIGNFNPDTKADIVTGQQSGLYINSYLGNPSNNYILPDLFTTANNPRAIHSNDFNGDGNKDLVYTNSSANSFSVLLGNGSGGFTAGSSFSTGTAPVSIISGDLNNDGKMDVVTADSSSNQISVFYGTGSGSFSAGVAYPAGNGPVSVKLGILNGDAFLDIAVANQTAGTISTLMSASGTSFGAPTAITVGTTPVGLVIFDRDADGDQDIVAANKGSNNITRLTNASGVFTSSGNTTTVTGPVSIDAGDFDGDGDIDAVVLGAGAVGRLNNISGTLTNVSYTIPSPTPAGQQDIKLLDVNSDGKLDVLALFDEGNSTTGTIVLLMGNIASNAAFNYSSHPLKKFTTELSPRGIALGDFNNDTRIDIASTNLISKSISIHFNTTPKITAGGPLTFCNGNSVTLTSTSALWYNWSPTSQTTQAISATTSGTYYTTTSSSWSDWCSSSSNSLIVAVSAGPSAPTVSNSGGSTICQGNTVTLTSSQATGNQWYKDGVLITGATNQTFVASTSGSYTVTYTTAGCTSPQSTAIVLTVSQAPVIVATGPTTFCTGGSVILHSNIGTNLTWSPGGATTQDLTVTTSGTYTATNTVGGCPALVSNSIVVTISASLATPTISPVGPVTLCPSGTVTLTSSSATNNIWSTGATTQSIVVSSAGSYFVHLDNGSCSSANSAPVSVSMASTPATPTITAGGPTTFCTGGSVTLTASAGTTYIWSTGATSASISPTTSGSYTVQVTNAAGCLSAASTPTAVTVNALPVTPTITAGGPTTFCTGGSVTLTSSAGTTYIWSPGGATTSSISATTSGSYTVQVTNAAGCLSAASAPTTVTVNTAPATPTITAGGPTTFCTGGSVTLTSSAGTTYLWSPGGATTSSISATTSGSYTVQVTNAAGCLSAASTPTVVTVNTAPSAPTITAGGPTTFCTGGSVTLTSSAGTTYLWSPGGATTSSISATTSGSYTVQVTNAAGCLSAASTPTVVTVNTAPATPTITAGGPTTFCTGGSVTLTSSAGTTYLWSPGGATTASISATTSGSYTVQVTNAAGCLSAASIAKVVTVNTAPSAPTITPGGSTTFCAGGSVTLTSSAGTTYLWSPGGATTASISATTSGSYTVQVTNPAGCLSPASAPTVVTVNAAPTTPTITAGGPTTFCTGGSVTLTASAGTTYLWSPGGATTASISATTSGSYTVQVTNAAGCLSAASTPTVVTVNTAPATPTITAGGPLTFCTGGSVTLTASAGTTYIWSPGGATTASISATTSGSYTVQVTNAAGCLSAASIAKVVTVNTAPSAPTITAGGPTTFCAGGSVTLTSSAGTTYLWSPGGATTASISATTSGSYTVQVTNPAGCLSPASTPTVVTVNAAPATPTITAGGPTTFCTGGSVTLTASAGTTYLWSPGGATTASISATTSGSYTVQVTNAGGCLSAASSPTVVTVTTTPATPTITAGGPTTFCSGGSVTLTASAGTTYLWSTGATTASISPTTSGSYTVQVTNAGGCLSAASTPTVVTVNAVPATPTITAGGPLTFCAGGSVTLTASAGTTYIWSPGGATTSSISATTSGSYTVQVTNAAGCLSAASIAKVVTVNAAPATPTITPSGSTSICAGGSVTLTASAGTTYLWSTGATTASISATTAGSYTVQVTNAAGCLSAASTPTTVTVNALPSAPTITAGGPTTFCAGGSVTLTSSAGTTYIWSTGATTASISPTTSGSYTVQVTNAAGCLSPASTATSVTVNAAPTAPTITAGGPTTFCVGGSVTLTASAGTTYLWSTGATTASISPTTSGSYTVQVTNAAGCLSPASAPTVVTVNALPTTPTITAGGSTTFCAGGSVTLTASAGTTYLWSTGATTASITATTAGSYTVQVTNAAGCQSAASIATTVTVNPLPAAPSITAGGPTTFCAGGSVTLTSSAGTTYIWSTGATTASISPTTSGSYTVQIGDVNGCLSTASTATTVTVNALPATPTITPASSTTFCTGGSVTLIASAGTTYLWSTGATTSSISATTSGSYTVQVTNAAGCLSAASSPTVVTVNSIPSTPTITAGGPTTFCSGGSVILTSSASSGNLWSSGQTTQSITVTTTGSYTVTQTLAGCTSVTSASTSVLVNPTPSTPTITAGGFTTFCLGGSVVLTSTAGTSYLWSTGETTQSITATASGSYSVQIVDGPCTSATSNVINVTANPIPGTPTITASGPLTFCSGNSVVLTSSFLLGNVWSTGETTQSITVTTTGSYTVEHILLGCSSGPSASTDVLVNPTPATPTITAGSATTFCAGGNVVLTSSSATGNVWSTGETTQSITVSTSGSYSVHVDLGPCSSATSNIINVTVNSIPAIPTIAAGGPLTFCAGNNVVLTSSASSGNLWSSGQTTQSITVTTTGSYTVTQTLAGCSSPASASTDVLVNPTPATPTITAGGSTSFCTGGSVVLTSSSATGNVWSTGETTQSITVSTSGAYSVHVDLGPCSSATSNVINVTVNPIPATPVITAGGPTTFCSGGSVTLTSSAGSGNLWSTGQISTSITVTTAGSYTVTQTLAGCSSPTSASTDVFVNPTPATPTITAGSATTFCAGGNVVLTSSSTTGNVWSTGETTQSITVSTSGAYSVHVDLGPCSSATSNVINVTANPIPAIPTISASGPLTFCSAGGSVILTSSATSGNLWSTGQTTQSITVTSTGSYTVERILAGCSSGSSAQVDVLVNPTPTTPSITAGSSTTFCTGGNVVLTSSSTTGNVWSTGETTQSITVTTSGSYSVQVVNGPCTSATSNIINVTANPIPATPTITAGGPTTFCSAGGSVVLTSSASSGNLWSTGQTSPSITVTTSGSYTVTQTLLGCSSPASAPVAVTVNPTPATPSITAGGTTVFCSGGSVVLTSTSATGNVWSTGETTQSITVTTSGSYSVHVDLGPCSSATSNVINVTVNPLPTVPTITAGGPTTFCSAGGSVVLTSSASSGNVWSTGQTTQSITVTTSGSYTVEQILLGCSSGSSVPTNVTVNPTPATPTITAGGSTTFCTGSSVVLTSSSATGNVWSTGETTQSITVTASGSYSVHVDLGPCSSATSNVINVTANPIPSTPTITAGGPTTFCSGGSVVLTSSASSGNTWSSGQTTQSITVTTSGVYTVNQTVLGCTSPNASQTITVNPSPAAPTVTTSGPTTFCAGGSVTLTSSVTSNITWSTSETTPSITVSASGSYTVTQTLAGCTSAASAPVNVVVNPLPAVPTITASGPTTFCAGGSVILTSSSPSNNIWSNGATTQSITVSTSGTYLVQVVQSGCTSGASAPKTVTVNSLPPAPTIVTGTTESICAGSSVTLTSSSTGGNLWSSGENTQSITVSAAGNFSVTVTDGNGCVSPASPTTVVTVNPIPAAPVISPNGPTSFCSGGSVMLSSSYTSGNLWSSGSTANAITVSSNGTYSVTYTDVNGCVSSPSTPVTVTVNAIPAAPVVTASGPTTFCSGGSVTLTSSYATGNSWSTSAMTQNITTTTSGVFSVIYIDGNGCASPSSSPVVVNVQSNPAPPSITAGGATTICQGSFVTLTSSYTSGNTWSSGGISQSINATVSGNYTVTFTNVNGCTSTSSPMTVTVIPVSSIPNISASGSTTICDGSSVTLTSSDPNSTWSTGATTQSINVTISGNYWVVGNQTGCPSQPSAPVIVNVNPAPATPIITPSGPTTICAGEELFLFTSGTGTNTWSTGYIGAVLQVTTSGNYWVSVQNVYGCSSSSVVVPVVVNSNPIVTVNPFQPLCSYAAPFTMSNGLPAGGTYTGNGISSNIFSPGTAGIGSSIVTYTYVDVNDCSASAQTTIDVNDCAGIDEKEEAYFSLFPNPNNGQFKVISTGTPMDQIIIYDAQGKMVFNESYSGIFTLEFDLNAYSNGVYYIEINSDQEIHERMPLIINH
jgi:hypothetical protein